MKKLHKTGRQSGFTLIELLVVIAIVAILAIVVILTLNPGQLIMQARDSNRISDVATIKSAIAYYMQDVAPTNWSGTASANAVAGTCYEDGPTIGGAQATSTCPWFNQAGTTVISTTTRVTNVSSSWIPISLAAISVGSPIGQWPVDPLNTFAATTTGSSTNLSSYYYSFTASTTVTGGFKIASHMESTKYRTGGTGDVESTDGGTWSTTYENGINLQL